MSRTIDLSGSQVRLILIGTALLLILGMGIRQSLGLFLAPVTHDLAVTAADFTLALAIQNNDGVLEVADSYLVYGDLAIVSVVLYVEHQTSNSPE